MKGFLKNKIIQSESNFNEDTSENRQAEQDVFNSIVDSVCPKVIIVNGFQITFSFLFHPILPPHGFSYSFPLNLAGLVDFCFTPLTMCGLSEKGCMAL